LLEREADKKHYIPGKTRETVLRRNPKWMGDLLIDRPIARPVTATMGKWHRANQDNYYSDTYASANNPNPYQSPQINLATEHIRRITPLEGFRIQGFPDEYWFESQRIGVSNTSLYRLIGNAVPVNLAQVVIDNLIGAYL
jgi:DNA (cytosine-5)-methyltransferase 1